MLITNFLVFKRVFAIIILSLLVTFSVSSVCFIQGLAAGEPEAPPAENMDTSESIDPGTDQLDVFTNDIGMTFVAISPGRYLMGSPSHELGRMYIYEAQHEITIEKQFYLQTTEVTQRQWKEMMGNNPSFFSSCGEDCPVENVSWLDVQKYIRELNRNSPGNRYRLPTESEWEYACRAGSTSASSNGDLRALGCHENSNLENIAWYRCNSDYTTHLVGQKRPNKMGIYDMHGNVNEWCLDDFVINHSDNFHQINNQIDPTVEKVVRGGSWEDGPSSCRSASRFNLKRSTKDSRIGFRLIIESKYHKIEAPPSLYIENEMQQKTKPIIATAPSKYKPTTQIEASGSALFAVQVASTKSLDYAESQVALFKKKGYNAYQVKANIPDKGIWYRICLGNFASISDAELFRKELALENIHGIILTK